ncbi:MAG: ArsR/SmtB family transcription factor [Halanaerobiales bacterium]
MVEENDRKCEICEVFNPNEKIVEILKSKQLDDETVNQLADLFKTMANPTRIKIIYSLRQRELCVCDITEILGMSPSAVSHQLRVLRNMKLVKYRKEGRSVYYSLNDDHVLALFTQGLEHVLED